MITLEGLTSRQLAFVEAYIRCLNGAEAARQAGYAHRDSAVETLRIPLVREYINSRLKELQLSTEELIAGFKHFVEEGTSPNAKDSDKKNALVALDRLTRIAALYKDKVEISNLDKKITVEYVEISE